MENTIATEKLFAAKEKLEQAPDKASALLVLKEAGAEIGYKPVFRALINGEDPATALHWKE